MGEMLYRLAACYALFRVLGPAQSALSPHQYGVDEHDGCTQVVQSLALVQSLTSGVVNPWGISMATCRKSMTRRRKSRAPGSTLAANCSSPTGVRRAATPIESAPRAELMRERISISCSAVQTKVRLSGVEKDAKEGNALRGNLGLRGVDHEIEILNDLLGNGRDRVARERSASMNRKSSR